MEASPLEIFNRWRLSLSGELFSQQMAFLCAHLGTTEEAINHWLHNPDAGHTEQVGTTVCVCGLIDFLMEKMSSAAYWDARMAADLEDVELVDAEAKEVFNELIGEDLRQRAEWHAAAEDWWALRAGALSAAAVREWEDSKAAAATSG